MATALSLVTIVVLAALFSGCESQTITTAPSNTSVLLGNNATLLCEVTGTQSGGDDLTWRKLIAGGDDSVFIGTNNNVNNATKHASTDKYRLHVLDTEISDEGEYQCNLFPDTYTAWVSVNVAPTTLTLKWPDNRDWTEQGQTANLTCTADTSRPPATFRWFKGSTEVTSQAVTPDVSTNANGYGAGVSYLEQTPSSSDEGTVYRCVADVPAQTSAVEKSLTLSFSGAGHVIASMALIGLTLLASMVSL